MSGKNITLSQACEGMIRYKQAAGKSDGTVYDYRVTFKKLLFYFPDDPPIASVTRGRMIEFFAWLQQEYITEPDGVAPRGRMPLSAKSVKNVPPTPTPTNTRKPGGGGPVDSDGDGYKSDKDCNDKNGKIHPGAPETPDDKVDSNCNGGDDE